MSWTSFTVLVEICGKIANCSSGSRGKLKKGDMQVGMKLRTKCRLGFPANISTGTVNNIFATNIVKLTLTKTG